VELTLTCDGGIAELVVRDQGIGIAPDELPRIFDRFYRTAAARAHAKTGTGLGLAIAKWIAEAHGGAIRVTSTPGHGSTFTVTLPISQPASSAV
jgi:signal transduction histidine kinase